MRWDFQAREGALWEKHARGSGESEGKFTRCSCGNGKLSHGVSVRTGQRATYVSMAGEFHLWFASANVESKTSSV